MWNKGFRTLLIISIKTKEKVRLTIPISLFVFLELLDCIRDLLAFISVVVPNIEIKVNGKKNKSKNLVNLLDSILMFLESIKYIEPFDMVDVITTDAKIKIKII